MADEIAKILAEEERSADSIVDDALQSEQKSGDELAAILLQDVAEVVTNKRGTHGDAVENMEHIAELWTTYLQGAGLLDDDQEITGSQAAHLMILLKLSRAVIGDYVIDHDRDVAGYGAISAACEVAAGRADESDLRT